MTSLPLDIKEQFFKMIKGDVPIEEFEKWLYADESLEQILKPDDFLGLISFDYKKKGAKYELGEMLKIYIDLGEYHTFKTISLLKFTKENHATRSVLEELNDLYIRGYTFLGDLGREYCRWEGMSEQQYATHRSKLLASAEEEIDRIIAWLKSGEIILVGQRDDCGYYFSFEDHREVIS